MRSAICHFVTAVLFLAPATVSWAAGSESPPDWAFVANPVPPRPDDGTVRRTPGSEAGYTLSQLRNLNIAPDWWPGDHPVPPPSVASGRQGVFACGSCHRITGNGGPENATLDGLPYDYIVQQLRDYRSGARSATFPERFPQQTMIGIAKRLSDAEIHESATYFSRLKPVANIKVVETNQAPATMVTSWFFIKKEGSEQQALNNRVIEVPDTIYDFENRNARATFTAYVPLGSLKRGEAIVRNSSSNVISCSTCHGDDLRGGGIVPPLAGRSPSYMMRHLFDFKQGLHTGANSMPMLEVAKNLSVAEMTDIVAYLASLPR